MVLKIYNTLTKKKEEFKSIKEKHVDMYVCGPTVNDVPHLGHARAQISFDVFRKYLEFKDYSVQYVSNITDIEDKIINKANEQGLTIKELTQKNEKEHLQNYQAIGVSKPTLQPRATEYVHEMIDLVQRLIKKGYTYEIENDGIYYDVSKFKEYGKLSGINLNELKSSRCLRDSSKGQEKKDPKDFVLWKFSKEGEPSWDAPFGNGRPGWHIECSAMTHSVFKSTFDIHGGGQDLIFPHHEDEIAQSEAGYDEKMCNYWVHNGMVNIDKVKMSKSLGNFLTIKDLLKEYSGEVIRYFVLNTHYRKPLEFSKEKLEEAKASYEKLKRKIKEIKKDNQVNEVFLNEFEKEMDEDINTAGAINVLWKAVNYEGYGRLNTIKQIDKVLDLNLLEQEKINLPQKVSTLLEERKIARGKKDYSKSDELRDKILKEGFIVKDTKNGQEIEKI